MSLNCVDKHVICESVQRSATLRNGTYHVAIESQNIITTDRSAGEPRLRMRSRNKIRRCLLRQKMCELLLQSHSILEKARELQEHFGVLMEECGVSIGEKSM